VRRDNLHVEIRTRDIRNRKASHPLDRQGDVYELSEPPLDRPKDQIKNVFAIYKQNCVQYLYVLVRRNSEDLKHTSNSGK
jgi:hypothetical protein